MNKPPQQLSLGIEGELRFDESTVRLAMLGCGSHTYRNVLPVLRFVPNARLEACCDLNLAKAQAYAHAFGARQAFADYREMLDKTEVDGVLVVLGFAADGRPRYPEIVSDLLRQGLSVWLEKPPAATQREVAQMQAAAVAPVFAQVGFKKMFAPATAQVRSLLATPEFDHISSYTYRYSVDLPSKPGDLTTPDGRRFLDDFVHVASVVVDLVGVPATATSFRDPRGDGIIVLQHASGTVGTVHLSANASGLETIEDVMIVGNGANVRIGNGVEVEYYPRGWRGPYGRSTSYFPQQFDGAVPDVSDGGRHWFPEFSLGTLSSGRHFVQGYYEELAHFVSCIAEARPPERGGLDDASRVMALVDAIRLPYGAPHSVAATPPRCSRETRPAISVPDVAPRCARTGQLFVLKDGWNYLCEACGATASAHEEATRPCPLASP